MRAEHVCRLNDLVIRFRSVALIARLDAAMNRGRSGSATPMKLRESFTFCFVPACFSQRHRLIARRSSPESLAKGKLQIRSLYTK